MDRWGAESVAGLLAKAESSWQTLSGRLLTWDNETLLDVGRLRQKGQATAKDTGSPQINEAECTFYATADPWQVRLQVIRDTASSRARYHTWAITAGGWWASDGAQVITSNDPSREASAYDLPALLRPGGLSIGLRIRSAERYDHAGRPGVRVLAEPTPELAVAVPELTVLGVDNHELIIDAELGIILRWEARLDGHPCRRDELSDLKIGDPLDAALFAPPEGLPRTDAG